MPTAHRLLGMAERSAVVTSTVVPLAGRTRLTATLDVARVGVSVTVVLEAAPTSDADAWDVLQTFGPLAAPASLTKTSIGDAPDFAVQKWHRYIRARIADLDGPATVELVLAAPFVDAIVDAALFSKEARSYSDVARLVGQAEDDVLGELMVRTDAVGQPDLLRPIDTMGINVPLNPFTPLTVGQLTPDESELVAGMPADPLLDARMDLAGFADVMRAAVVQQTEHRYRRTQLELSTEAGSFVSLRNYPPLAPGLMKAFERYRNSRTSVWRGR